MAKSKVIVTKKKYITWEPSDKKRALVVYKATGSPKKTADITGIPLPTIERWQQADWWKEQLLALKNEDSAELEEAATNLAKQAADAVRDRLLNGDVVLTRDGEQVRKPIGGRDAAIIMGISLQKRKELMDTERVHDQLGATERLLKLVGDFAKFANAKEVKGVLAESVDDQQARQQEILEQNKEKEHEIPTTDYRLLEEPQEQNDDVSENPQTGSDRQASPGASSTTGSTSGG